MNDGKLYLIRVREDAPSLKEERFAALEKLLQDDARAGIEYVIASISAVVACIYDDGLLNSIEGDGYELILQEKRNMLYDSTQPIASPTVDSIELQ